MCLVQKTSCVTTSTLVRSMTDAALQARLLKHVSPVPFSGCWIWTGFVKPNGYGTLTVNRKPAYAHRAAYAVFRGPIPDGMCVCHHCDVRSCINPDHLFLGTQKENLQDMDAKGRRVTALQIGAKNPMHGRSHSDSAKLLMSHAKKGIFKGEKHPKATVSESLVRAIKSAKGGMTAKAVAEKFHVSWHVVRNIWSGKSWGFVNG